MHARTHTTVLWLSGLWSEQPGWAATIRNIHPLTLIMVISQPLSASSNPWHPPCSETCDHKFTRKQAYAVHISVTHFVLALCTYLANKPVAWLHHAGRESNTCRICYIIQTTEIILSQQHFMVNVDKKRKKAQWWHMHSLLGKISIQLTMQTVCTSYHWLCSWYFQ